jgi:hypothetical protein
MRAIDDGIGRADAGDELSLQKSVGDVAPSSTTRPRATFPHSSFSSASHTALHEPKSAPPDSSGTTMSGQGANSEPVCSMMAESNQPELGRTRRGPA